MNRPAGIHAIPGAGGRPGERTDRELERVGMRRRPATGAGPIIEPQEAPLAACSSFSITRSSEKLAAF